MFYLQLSMLAMNYAAPVPLQTSSDGSGIQLSLIQRMQHKQLLNYQSSLPVSVMNSSTDTSKSARMPLDGQDPYKLHRNFPCIYCSHRCKSKRDLEKHIRTHTGEKPFKCSLCSYETGDQSNLKRHFVGVHGPKQNLIRSHSDINNPSGEF